MQHTVDVIVLTYKPPKGVLQLIEMIEKQDYPIQKLILMNTEEKYFDERFYGTGFLEKYNNIEVHHISGKEFDHGRTRNRATAYSNADIFVCMTQDAIPADTALIGHLVEALQQPKVAAAYARQLPLPDCREIEKYTRSFNYPEESRIKPRPVLYASSIPLVPRISAPVGKSGPFTISRISSIVVSSLSAI